MSETRKKLAEALWTAREQGSGLDPLPAEIPTSIADAYAVQDDMISLGGHDVAGWKIGTIPERDRAAFGQSRFSGPIFGHTVHSPGSTCTIPLQPALFNAIEAEAAVNLRRDIEAEADIDDARSSFGHVHVGVELLASVFAKPVALGAGAIVSDLGLNAGAIIGPEAKMGFDAPTADKVSVQITSNGTAERHDAEMNTDVRDAIRFLFRDLERRGHRLREGEWIFTGSITGLHPVFPGDQATIAINDQTILKIVFSD